MKKLLCIYGLVLLTSFQLIGCSKNEVKETIQTEVTLEVTQENDEVSVTDEENVLEETFEEYEIVLMALGDNLMHMGIVSTGEQADGSYNYDILFQGIEDCLEAADIKIINQETILGGNSLGFSGYPLFNSPTEVGDAIAKAGFNVVLQSSNHSADRGLDGMLNCIDFWENTYPEVTMVGIHEESKEEHPISVIEIKGIKFAILNYTYSPNSEVLPKSVQGKLDMLCNWDTQTGQIDFLTLHPQVIKDIERAEEMADFTIVCPHWGTEYATTPSTVQKEFAMQMAEAGADLIVGTHPHVVQPVEWVEDSRGEKTLCYYSLGNYVSTQKDPLCMLEGMAWVTLTVTEEGIQYKEEEIGMFPMVCQYNSNPVRFDKVYFLEDYSKKLAKNHGIIQYGGVDFEIEDLQRWSEEIIGEWVLSPKTIIN